jgi:LTXXQ motif family protein
MTTKIFKVLVSTVALAALVLGTEPGMAAKGGRGGGGGGGHGGGGHGGGGFSAAHFSGARMGGGPHIRSLSTHGPSTHGRNLARSNSLKTNSGKNFSKNTGKNFTQTKGKNNLTQTTGKNFTQNHNDKNWNHNSKDWNHWGNHWHNAGWNGGGWWGGWWGGSVFWPFFYGDLLASVFWPFGFYPIWYEPYFVWDAIFWPGPAYAYGPYDDVYGYAYGGPARTRTARRVTPETTGSVPSSADLAQSCGGLAPGVTDLPLDRIQQSLQLTGDQLKSLDALKAASAQASDALTASCSSEVPMTPLGRLDMAQKRIDGMVQAWATMRTPLDDFYNSLNDEQRQRFAALGPASSARSGRRGSASGDNLAALCSSRTESFTQLPVQRVEQSVKPTQQQQDALEKLKAASTQAANQLQASCPAQSPQTALDRFDAVGKRLNAMAGAIGTVRPALADFYSSLTDEQKARFNTLGPPQNASSRPG